MNCINGLRASVWDDLCSALVIAVLYVIYLKYCMRSWANYILGGQKTLFMVAQALLYFSHAILCLEHTVSLNTIIDHSFHHYNYAPSFLT